MNLNPPSAPPHQRSRLPSPCSAEGQREAEGEALFVPTGSMALLETLHDARPNHSIIAADFDHLPDVKIPGKNAPLVAEKVRPSVRASMSRRKSLPMSRRGHREVVHSGF